MKVKDQSASAAKWASRAAAAGPAYTAGVQSPKAPWAASTAAAAPNWAAGVQTAVTNGRFAAGVNKAGDAKWQSNAVTKGSQRFTQGVQGAAPNYQTGFAPYMAALSGATLPPRFPKGDPGNANRSAFVATLLHNKKMGK